MPAEPLSGTFHTTMSLSSIPSPIRIGASRAMCSIPYVRTTASISSSSSHTSHRFPLLFYSESVLLSVARSPCFLPAERRHFASSAAKPLQKSVPVRTSIEDTPPSFASARDEDFKTSTNATDTITNPHRKPLTSPPQIATPSPFQCRILICGLGGAGGNAVDNFVRGESFDKNDVELMVVNTDAQALGRSLCERRFQIGRDTCRGLGAGGLPLKGRKAAEESLSELMDIVEGVDCVFFLAGAGGGTGTGSLPVIAAECKKKGILTVAVVTTPFRCEGARRWKIAREALNDVEKTVDSLIVVPNENIMRVTNSNASVTEAFQMADDVLLKGVKGVVDIITTPAQVNLDFADVHTVFRDSHRAYMSTGYGYSTDLDGEESAESIRLDAARNAVSPRKNRAQQAIESALYNPLLNIRDFQSGNNVLLNITGHNLKMVEVTEIADYLRARVSEDANIILGTNSLDAPTSKVGDDHGASSPSYIKVTVVITGLDKIPPEEQERQPTRDEPKQESAFDRLKNWFAKHW
uniref:Cell division protein FtsZ n=1 Tax=Percolomonas cosmopolitus TaxID=63605 RepID=A0A7S1PGA2_9EUKA